MMTQSPESEAVAEANQAGHWFIFQGERLLVTLTDGSAALPILAHLDELGLAAPHHFQLSGSGRACYAARISETSEPPPGMSFQALRRLYGLMDEELFWLAGRASQVLNWDQTRLYCGRCGARMSLKRDELAKICHQCNQTEYHNPAPAIIVLIENGDRLLLARSQRHPSGMYSVLAGFVEAGESLETAVMREIREEVGIEVKEIRYFGSQPWPFPDSLMIAFTCTYAGGEIRLQASEIADAGWYTAVDLPTIPPPISIARRLIDSFLSKHQQEPFP